MPLLKEWENFYVIVGSAAAALTGLQFVAAALIADIDAPATTGTLDAFATPTIVHFSAALMLSALLSAPWRTAGGLAIALAIGSFAGIGYTLVVARRSRRQSDYQPVFEDWLFHVILPACAYVSLAIAADLLNTRTAPALATVAAAVLLLLTVGIHNAWDTVTYLVVVRRRDRNAADVPGRAPNETGTSG